MAGWRRLAGQRRVMGVAVETKPDGEPTVAEVHAAWVRLLPGLPGDVRDCLLREWVTEDLRPAYACKGLPPPSWGGEMTRGDRG